MRLPELQQAFAAWLRAEPGADGARTALPILPHGLAPARRLAVHRNNAAGAQRAALAGVYRVLERLVGVRFFARLAVDYLLAFPSRSGALHTLGARMPGFCAGYAPLAALPYAADVARLEWVRHEAFHSADALPLDPAALAGLAPQQAAKVRFLRHPACRLVESAYPVLRIWSANQDGADPTMQVDLAAGGESVLVVRPALAVAGLGLSPATASFARALLSGAGLEDAIDQALLAGADFSATATLPRLITAGAFAGLAPFSPAHGEPRCLP